MFVSNTWRFEQTAVESTRGKNSLDGCRVFFSLTLKTIFDYVTIFNYLISLVYLNLNT